MTFFQRHPHARWIVPAVAAGAVVGTQLVGSAANAAPVLPQKTPQQLVDAVLAAKVAGYSGTVESTADLGLPALPSSMSTTSSNLAGIPLALLTGTHTMQVWHAEGTGDRVALHAAQAETDVVTTRRDVWVWNSADRSAAHLDVAKAEAQAKAQRAKDPKAAARHQATTAAGSYTPQQVAASVLDELGKSTVISSTDNTTVAGRSAYDLVLAPKTAATKVGSVHIAVDADTSLPLRVAVYAKGAEAPALQVGFTEISYATPAASTFAFSAPSGSTVTELGDEHPTPAEAGAAKRPAASRKVVGSDWSSVLVTSTPAPSKAAASSKAKASKTSGSMSELVATLPAVSGSWGRGHLLDTSLFSAVLTDDGRLAAGAVQPASLYAALTTR